MAISKTPKFWGASAAALLAGSLAACGEGGEAGEAGEAGDDAGARDAAYAPGPAGESGEGEGGEGEGGGEAGGEFGIDPAVAESDPVVYQTAIEVMRAHYIAGLAALENGERGAASEMFSHPISEIYLDLEPVIEARGGRLMGEAMNRAAVLHFQGAETSEIRAAVDEVLTLLDVNLGAAPAVEETREAFVEASVLAALMERAALQYQFAAGRDAPGEAWLDGYGLQRAASRYAEDVMSGIRAADQAAGMAFQASLDMLADAYAGAQPRDVFDPDPAAVVGAADAAVAAARALEPGPTPAPDPAAESDDMPEDGAPLEDG